MQKPPTHPTKKMKDALQKFSVGRTYVQNSMNVNIYWDYLFFCYMGAILDDELEAEAAVVILL